jgi:hypothetical protein
MQQCVCGAGNSDAAKFCAECGRGLGKQACPKCGAESATDVRFCTSCGAAFSSVQVPHPAESVQGKAAWNLDLLFKPIASVEQARLMAQTGAIAAGIIAVYMAFAGLSLLELGGAAVLLQYGQVAIHAACAFALWRGWTIGGLVSLALHAFNVISGLVALNAAGIAAEPLGPTDGFLLLIMVFLVPAALVMGIRGCMGWNRIRRGEAGPAATP